MPPKTPPTPDPPPRSISTGAITSGGGAVAVGGDVYDQRTTVLQAAPTTPTATRSIPAPTGDFVGRAAEIDALVAELRGGGVGAAISGLRGLGGIGKTQLALVVAARLAEQYPDGQVFLSLYGATATPAPPEVALTAVIRAFAPDAAHLPDALDALRATYLTLLKGKRVLVLADDAAGPEQVRPLVPPPGCALLITSRRHFVLPGLQSHALDALPAAEAITLVRSICARLTEADAARLAALCGGLPLALRTAASLLAVEPHRPVARYLAELADERTRLRALQLPDDSTLDVQASLLLSWAALHPAAETALAQLSVFPAPFDFAAAIAVVELHHGDTEARRTEEEEEGRELEAVLGDLLRRSLLDYDEAADRYRLHDLVRVFAAARLPTADTVRWRHGRHYAAVAAQAGNLYDQGGDELIEGLTLFDRERAHIDGAWTWVREQAASAPAQADLLLPAFADATVYIGDMRYDKQRERIPQYEAALAAARRLGRQDAEGVFLVNLGAAYTSLGEARQALSYYEQGLAVARKLGDRRSEGSALGSLGIAYADLGEVQRAISYYEQDLAIAQELRDRRSEGATLNNLGNAFYILGEMRRAIGYYEQVLAIMRTLGDRRGESAGLGNLGAAYQHLGEPERAILYYKQRLDIARAIGDRQGEGNTLGNLGVAYENLGEWDRAIAYYEQHLAITRVIGDRQGEAICSWNLGLLWEQQGDLARAVELMQVRVDYFREIGHPAAEECAAYLAQVRARLAGGGGARADHE